MPPSTRGGARPAAAWPAALLLAAALAAAGSAASVRLGVERVHNGLVRVREMLGHALFA